MSYLVTDLKPMKGVRPVVRLRWEFHYYGGKVVAGRWNGSEYSPGLMAKDQPRSNLNFVAIKAEIQHEWSQKTLVRVPASEFEQFRWMAGASSPGFFKKDSPDKIKSDGHVVGLIAVTRKEKITAMIDGSITREKTGEN